MSGKKSCFLDGQLIHTSTSMKPKFSFSTHVGNSMVTVGASEDEPHYLRIDGVYFNSLPYYTPPGGNEYMNASQRQANDASEHRHAQKAMHSLDEDFELATKLQEGEQAERLSVETRESEDMKMARQLQEEYDREHSDHQEYLRKSGVTTTSTHTVATPAVAAPVDLMSFDDDHCRGSLDELLNPAIVAANPPPHFEEANFEVAGTSSSSATASTWQDFGGDDFLGEAALMPAKKSAPPTGMKPPSSMPPPQGMPVKQAPDLSLAFSDMDNMFLQHAPQVLPKETGRPVPGKSFDDIDPLAGFAKTPVVSRTSTSSMDYVPMKPTPPGKQQASLSPLPPPMPVDVFAGLNLGNNSIGGGANKGQKDINPFDAF
jgi:hypothetical protein